MCRQGYSWNNRWQCSCLLVLNNLCVVVTQQIYLSNYILLQLMFKLGSLPCVPPSAAASVEGRRPEMGTINWDLRPQGGHRVDNKHVNNQLMPWYSCSYNGNHLILLAENIDLPPPRSESELCSFIKEKYELQFVQYPISQSASLSWLSTSPFSTLCDFQDCDFFGLVGGKGICSLEDTYIVHGKEIWIGKKWRQISDYRFLAVKEVDKGWCILKARKGNAYNY